MGVEAEVREEKRRNDVLALNRPIRYLPCPLPTPSSYGRSNARTLDLVTLSYIL